MKKSSGYTIVELLIFIGVSAAIFFAALTAIGGRQEQVQFAQGVREFDAKIRDILNDVTTGYYPSSENVSCRATASGPEVFVDTDAALGTNNQCLYIGKAIQFQPEGRGQRVDVYTMAGLRYEDNDLTPSSSIASAQPIAVARTGNDGSFVDATEPYDLLYGLRVTKVLRPLDGTPTTYGLIGIFSQFGGSGVSESQSVQVGGIVDSQLGADEGDTISLINDITDAVEEVGERGYIEKNTNEGIVICLESIEGQKASITFGARGTSATKLDIDNYDRRCD